MNKEEIKSKFEKYKKRAVTIQYNNKESGSNLECKVVTLLDLKQLEIELLSQLEKDFDQIEKNKKIIYALDSVMKMYKGYFTITKTENEYLLFDNGGGVNSISEGLYTILKLIGFDEENV